MRPPRPACTASPRHMALEVARKGVTVNTISPGYIGIKMVTAIPKEVRDSKILPQIPLGRLGAPDEIAGLIVYLCSDEAAFVSGANIAINGGQNAIACIF
ncbi:MAG TPA: SDR family oxidoreductase [Steroidobacteraceae bacterium]|nr:SDR family oxidoreductase [Steroidobacteraceae bacterium]